MSLLCIISLLCISTLYLTGTLALKTDTAGVEMFYLCGNQALPDLALPAEEGGLCLLKISQRMKLEKPQLEGLDWKIKVSHTTGIPKLGGILVFQPKISFCYCIMNAF